MTAVIIIFALVIIYISVIIRPQYKDASDDPCLTADYAHRGLVESGLKENSLTAFRRSAEEGFGIELDVQLSSDGEVMVFHDYTLSRMTGEEGKLSDKTANELSAISLCGGEDKIPTFREVLDAVDGRVPLLVELKGENTDTSVCKKTAELLDSYKGKYTVESFNPFLIAWFRKHRPNVSRGLLVTGFSAEKGYSPLSIVLDSMLLNCIARPNFIAFDLNHPSKLSVWLTTKLFRAKRFTWTARGTEEYKKSRDLGSRVIFEDREIMN